MFIRDSAKVHIFTHFVEALNLVVARGSRFTGIVDEIGGLRKTSSDWFASSAKGRSHRSLQRLSSQNSKKLVLAAVLTPTNFRFHSALFQHPQAIALIGPGPLILNG